MCDEFTRENIARLQPDEHGFAEAVGMKPAVHPQPRRPRLG